jgi:hypothetical protein
MRAHDRQRLHEQRVPALGGQRVMRLVEQLEREAAALAGVALSDLRPQREEAGRLTTRVGGELVEMVDVEDDVEITPQRPPDRLVDTIEEAAVDPVGGGASRCRPTT